MDTCIERRRIALDARPARNRKQRRQSKTGSQNEGQHTRPPERKYPTGKFEANDSEYIKLRKFDELIIWVAFVLLSQTLFKHLTRCLGFISRALKRKDGEGGGSKGASLLVHCHAGESRSVAVVAAYLMRVEGIGYQEALDIIRKVNPRASPNEGFEEQLKLYEQMGCRIDVNSPLYRQHLLRQQTKQTFREHLEQKESKQAGSPASGDGETNGMDTERKGEADSSSVTPSAPPGKGNENENEEEYVLLCRKCRAILAVSSQVIEHKPPENTSAMSRKWQQQQAGGMRCSSLYVEPIKWMEEVEKGANEGKLNCYKCQTRVGHFSWSGIQCSCSQWVTPAFQIHKSKIDIVQTRN